MVSTADYLQDQEAKPEIIYYVDRITFSPSNDEFLSEENNFKKLVSVLKWSFTPPFTIYSASLPTN